MNQKFDDQFDYYNKESICKYFRNKYLMKIDKYLKHLNAIFKKYLYED